MSTPRALATAMAGTALMALLAVRAGAAGAPAAPGRGEPVTEASLARLDITIDRNGRGLPPGRGDVARGSIVYAEQCAACHGAKGAGGVGGMPALTGGVGSLASAKPLKTVNSFWPYAPLVFDYIRRTMPITQPLSLAPGDVYAVTAYLLSVDGIVPPNAVLGPDTLRRVKMPNRDGFVPQWPTAPGAKGRP